MAEENRADGRAILVTGATGGIGLEAARMLARQPEAMQLRFLQTLSSIAGDKSNTIVFPVPVDEATAGAAGAAGAALPLSCAIANIGTAAAVVAAARVRNLRRDGTLSSGTGVPSFLDMLSSERR